MSNKVWWKSKTLWVNAIAASLVAAEAVTGAQLDDLFTLAGGL